MTASHTGRPDDAGAVCRRLVDIGIALAVEPELPAVLDRVLGEARGFTGAEAGTIFLREGDRLRFAAVHNDVLDDELALWSERDLLLTRLVECKTFKDAAIALHELANDAGRSFPRVAGPDERFIDLTPDVLEGVTPADLHAAFLRAVTPKPQARIDLDHVAPIRASVTDASNTSRSGPVNQSSMGISKPCLGRSTS